MSRAAHLSFIIFLFALISTPAFAQDQPRQRRGMGFGGGRGAGPGPGFGQGRGQGRGMRLHAAGNDSAAPTETPKGDPTLAYPVIANHGGVVKLPDAVQQPRAGTKLLVDLTGGSDADKINGGLEKIAKYINLFAGGGAEPADVKIAVVIHGDATLIGLKPDAYAAKMNTDGNPNLKLLQQLSDSGVDLYVCGQSLISKGSDPSEVSTFVKTAVSAMTAVVNLQTDGYAYLPLAKASSVAPATEATASHEADHEHGPGMGHGPGRGQGMGRGPGAMSGMQGDMTTLHAMFADRDKIKRTVKMLPNGAEAVTESDDEAIADLLKEHVPAMEERVLGDDPLPPMTFHPIFVGLIKHADDYELIYEETEKGMKVTYHSDDPYVVMLVQEHAKLVSRFIKNGMEEIHTPYELPEFPKKNASGGDGR